MALTTKTSQRPTDRFSATSVFTLAFWRWRQHWFLLLMTGLGMIASVIILCAVPLLSETMATAGLRGVLRASPDSSEITLIAKVAGLSTQGIEQASQVVNQPLQQYLGPSLNGSPRLDFETPLFDVLSPSNPGSRNQMAIYAASMRAAAPHVTLVQGRLPQAINANVEVAITPDTASLLGLSVGSLITLNGVLRAAPSSPIATYSPFPIRVVGIFNVKPGDAFWHGYNFLPSASGPEYTVLASDQNVLAAFDRIAARMHTIEAFFPQPSYLTWYYRLNPSNISIDQLDDLINRLAAMQASIATTFSDPYLFYVPPYIGSVDASGTLLHTSGIPSTLERFRGQLAVARIPLGLLALQVLGLMLFFVSMMAALLVERQADAIALLRSRGARRSQVFGAFLTQSVGLSLIALAAGPPLALIVVYLVAQRLLPATNRDPINFISQAPMQALLHVAWYAIAAAVVTIAMMLVSLYRASRRDAWATEQRTPQRPLWQVLHLDIAAVIIGLSGYGIAVYLASIENLLDAQTQALVISPLVLLAPLFLLLAAILLSLRIFPLLLHLGSRFALRGRGAAPMLALAQMARAPRQPVRMVLLLALTTAFALFTLVFAASQAQRADDIAAYQVGADFSGDLPDSANHFPLQGETALYRHIPGVVAATSGYIEDDTSSANAAALPVRLQAVDPGTFAPATLPLAQDSSPSFSSLLAQLAERRTAALQSGIAPAIIDDATASALSLHVGASFSLYKSSVPTDIMHYVVIAEVQHIPALTGITGRGVLVDYSSFAAIQAKNNNTFISVNHIWLHTSSDAASLAQVRAALNTPALQLDNLADRYSLTGSLRNDPLVLNLLALLAIGTTAALLLALAGNLLASWLSVRRRLTNFTVLRALGAAPQQLASVLTWEQGMIYTTALLLGIVFGGLLTVTTVPTLVESVVPVSAIAGNVSNSEWFALQHSIPFQIVVPPSLEIALLVLVGICIISLAMMVRVASQPVMSQVLRLDENQSSEYLTREDAILPRSTSRQKVSPSPRPFARPAMVTLALWQLRRVWLLWLVQGVGIVAATAIVCTVPLFSMVTTTAELHAVLTATPATSEITLDTSTQGLSSKLFASVQHQLDPVFQRHIGTYLSQPTSLFIRSAGFRLLSSSPVQSKDEVQLMGMSIEQAASYLRLVQGRLPQNTTNGEIETLLTPETAQRLHVTVGSLITLGGDFFTRPQDMFGGANTMPSGVLRLRVVGIFTLTAANAGFWHGETFQPVATNQAFLYSLLIPAEAFLAALDQLAAAAHTETVFSPQTFELTWHYRLDAARITPEQVDDLSSRLTRLQASITNTFSNVQQSETQPDGLLSSPYLVQVNLFNPVPGSYSIVDTLDQYRNRTAVVSIPVTILSLQVFGLILFFVSLSINLLVERQAAAIAVVRSRGASNSQIFSALLTQSISLGAMALVAGPLLAAFIVSFTAQHVLGVMGDISPGPSSLIQAAWASGWYAAGTVFVVLVVMSFLLWRAASVNVLLVRCEASRTTWRPLWQRLYLDIVAALIALTGYAISLYLASVGKLFDVRTQALVSAPLTLIAPIFLLLGGLILFLRFFPSLLRLGEQLAVRSRGAIPMLALAQMARTPRQALRMTLLLALAIAFAIFTLVFAASQAQRIADIAAYESGADFSGDLPVTGQHLSVGSETARYHHIPGVTSATVGFSGTGSTSGTASAIPLQIRAVDASTFAQTAAWTAQDSSQPLASLMTQLVAARNAAVQNLAVPAIVDAAMMSELDLHMGDTFTITVTDLPYSTLGCVVIAQVQHIPTVNDSAEPGNTGNDASPGGVLLDYTTFATLYAQAILASGTKADPYLPINHVWLRTADDPTALAHARTALALPNLHLDNLYDRRMLMESMRTDPLYLGLILILAVGAATALLLTLGGDLLASWLSVRTRLTSFVVLRSLGVTPGQVTGVLLWEQGIVYAAALLLGVIFGAALSATAVPTLSFTSTPPGSILSSISSDEFYLIQRIIPTHIVIPPTLGLAFMAFIAVCVLALGMMAGVVLRPSMSQTLRLDVD